MDRPLDQSENGAIAKVLVWLSSSILKQKFNFDLKFLKAIQSYLQFGLRTFYLMKKSAEVLRKPQAIIWI